MNGGGPVAGILLAAGEGRRFGTPKALVEFAGTRLVERGVGTLAGGGCSPVIVVLGAAADEILEKCDLDKAVVVVNESWADGMGSSLRAGLEEADRQGAEAVLVLPVDQPLVDDALLARLIDTWRTGSPAAVAAIEGEGRTPVIVDRSLWPQISAHAIGDSGGRNFLRANPHLVKLVNCAEVGQISDIDWPRDLEHLENIYLRHAQTSEHRPPDGAL